MKWNSIKLVLVIFIGVLFIIQFYQPARNLDKNILTPLHISETMDVPVNVMQILKSSCFDCHSNNTNYPWYSYIQPVRSIMERHIKNGKENLNFSEFGSYSRRKQDNKLDRIAKQIKSNEMPLPSYLLIHSDAKLSEIEKTEIINWINDLSKPEI